MMRGVAIGTLVCAATACSGDALDLGDGPFESELDKPWSGSATWEGYVDGYESPSGSNRIQLVLDDTGSGQVTFGAGQPPRPPESAEHPFDFGEPHVYGVQPPLYEYGVWQYLPAEGFRYTVENALIQRDRVRVTFNVYQVFEAACALQTPTVPRAAGGFTCAPDDRRWDWGLFQYPSCVTDDDVDPATGEKVAPGSAVSCSQLNLCYGHCECDAQTCRASVLSDTGFDAVLDARTGRLEGSLMNIFGRGVRMRRAR